MLTKFVHTVYIYCVGIFPVALCGICFALWLEIHLEILLNILQQQEFHPHTCCQLFTLPAYPPRSEPIAALPTPRPRNGKTGEPVQRCAEPAIVE